MRLLASLAHYVATRDATGLQIHQYAAARIVASGIALRMDTKYPWAGDVRLHVEAATTGPAWTLALRVPDWCTSADVRINGRSIAGPAAPGEYVRLERAWARGDHDPEIFLEGLVNVRSASGDLRLVCQRNHFIDRHRAPQDVRIVDARIVILSLSSATSINVPNTGQPDHT